MAPSLISDLLARRFPGKGMTVIELARRLDLPESELRSTEPTYHTFTIPKRTGGERVIEAPAPRLKEIQRRILKRLLARLQVHPAAMAYQKGTSILDNAAPHAGKPVVIKMDIQDFFGSTKDSRVRNYFRAIGWNRDAAGLLTRLCCHRGALPQGAPTSPALSNLVNYKMDTILNSFARRGEFSFSRNETANPRRSIVSARLAYTRYADDITFSSDVDDPALVGLIISFVTGFIAPEFGYRLHPPGSRRGRRVLRNKLIVIRRYRRQLVTGLVVNDRPRLPRRTRRWLRAVEHRLATGREATLTPAQLQGWRALNAMIETRANGGGSDHGPQAQ